MSEHDDREATHRTDSAERTVREERTLTPMRKTISSRLSESYRQAVHVTVNRTIDAGPVVTAAEDAKAGDPDRAPSIADVLLCALSDALTEWPAFNATYEEGTHRLYEEQNVGVAVTIDDGLVTPVLADLASKSLYEVAAERRRLTELVQSGDYTMSLFRNGTFTVSNLGPLGIDSFDPVINPPEIGILGIGRTSDRAVVSDGNVRTRPHLTLSLSFDHRVVDGADAARFLDTLASNAETASKYV
ncbi:2-oxo acid dehydrogenase subunit E2 [Halobellus rufus]|uniref:2-oxo acid dehydrogenase subunit E2 n=1 Tax=Halobellus rufus TaxID=1448860 RepID=UPI00067969C7|nr:2-oxo acid dehydrogenase subunit E2 [Halobellus rufus]